MNPKRRRELFKNKNIGILLVLAIVVSMTVHWIKLSRKLSDIDRLEIALHDLKPLIPPGANVTFKTNLVESSPKTELYFESQFVMCPVIITQESVYDTVLIVQKKDKPYVPVEGKSIFETEKFDLKVSLLVRQKPVQ